VFGDGSMRRTYTYIDDIIQGVRAAIDYDATMYEVFNLGESQTTELRELISLLEQNLDMHAIIDRQPMQPGDVRRHSQTSRNRAKCWAYDPTTKIEDGIRSLLSGLGVRVSAPMSLNADQADRGGSRIRPDLPDPFNSSYKKRP
jgi:UDP-glucuronate 4-epimerase